MSSESPTSSEPDATPTEPLSARVRRWARTTLRTLHIATFGVLLGGVVLAVPYARYELWLIAAAASGALLTVTFLIEARPYWSEVRGIALLIKLTALLLAITALSRFSAWLLLGVVALSAVVSHMPGRWRHLNVFGATKDRDSPYQRG